MTAKTKQIVFTVIAVVVIAAISVVAFFVGLYKGYKAPSPLRCLPTSTTAVVRMSDRAAISQRADESRYGDDLLNLSGGYRVMLMAARIDSLFKESAVTEPELSERDLYVSFTTAEDGTMTRLTASFCLNNRMEWHNAMSALRERDDIWLRDTTVSGRGLFVLTQEGEDDPLFMAAGGGCLFASESPDLLLTFGTDSVVTMRDDPAFATIERTVTNNSPISMFVNTLDIRRLSRSGVEPLKGTLANAVLGAAAGSDWVALDLALHDDGVSADGFVVAAHPSLNMMLAREATSKLAISRRIPTTVKYFERLGMGRRGLTSPAYTEFLGSDSAGIAYRTEQSVLYRQTDVDVEAILSQVFEHELALCSYSDSIGESDFLVIDTHGGTMAQALFTRALTALHGGAAPLVIGEITPRQTLAGGGVQRHSHNADAQHVGDVSIPVYGAFGSNDHLFFLKDIFARPIPKRLFFRYEDAIVLADNMETLRRVLADYVVGNTMEGSADYAYLLSHFGNESSNFVFERPMDDEAFGTVCRQLTMAGRLPYVSLFARVPQQGERDANRNEMWKIRLDTAVVSPLRAVKNHYSQLSECLVQDAMGRVNLIGADGMLLWKRAVDGPIVGDVSQVDFYSNGKLQYLFTTERSLYIVDRLGNDVGAFPVHLPSPSVTGVTAAQYSDGSPLRLFVGCKGGPVLYGPEAKVIDGFVPVKTEGQLKLPVRHHVCNGKDYIMAADHYTYYYMDRRGNIRLKPESLSPSEKSVMMVSPDGGAFVMTTVDGQVTMIDEASAAVSLLKLDSIGTSHRSMPVTESLYLVAGGRYAALVDVSGPKPAVRKHWLTGLNSADQLACASGYFAIMDKEFHQARLYSAASGEELPCSPVSDVYGSIAIANAKDGVALLAQRKGGEIVELLLDHNK